MAEIILFSPWQRLFERARRYVDNPGLFAREKEKALPVVIRALTHPDPRFRHQLMMLLSNYAEKEACRPFYDILSDVREEVHTRHFAALRLCAIFPFLDEPKLLADKLLADLAASEADLRRFAATALGWGGLKEVFGPLTELLDDPDLSVRLAAIYSLCTRRDKAALPFLTEKLEKGVAAEKRAVLYNVWRLDCSSKRLSRLFARYTQDPVADVRMVALTMLCPGHEKDSYGSVFVSCLSDSDSRIVKLALQKLLARGGADLICARSVAKDLLDHPDMEIKRLALSALGRMEADEAASAKHR